EIARALDGTRQFALLLGRNRGDPTRHDLASFGDEAAQKLDVLVVDLRRVGAGEGTGLAATEEGTARCAPLADDLNAHGSTLPARTTVSARAVAAAATAAIVPPVLALHHR